MQRKKETSPFVRIGVTTMIITAADKRNGVFYDRLFALCDRALPGCGCDVVLLPERSACRPGDRQPLDGPIFRRFSALARRRRLWLVAPLVEARGRRTFNTQVAISPRGELVALYRKVHLAPGEERDTSPGDAFTVFDTPWFRAGMLICFDNKFPESARCLALQGASVLFCPSYGDPSKPMRNAARCLDNNLYFAGSGVIDRSCLLPPSRFERGIVIDPDGWVLVNTDMQEGLAVAELPLDAANRLVAPPDFDFLARRRPECYGELVRGVKTGG